MTIGLVSLACVLVLFYGPMVAGRVPGGVDNTFFHLPFFSLRALGWFPLWNPYEFCGLPLAGNLQFGLFYPPALIFGLWDALTVYRWFILGHYFWAGLGMWLVARRWGLSGGSALTSAVAYMCGGYLYGRISNPIVFVGCAWLPWALWAAHRAHRSRRVGDAVVMGAVLALTAHAGSPHGLVYGLMAAGIFLVMATAAPNWVFEAGDVPPRRRWSWREVGCGAGLIGLGGLTFWGLSAPALLPALELMGESVRGAATFEDAARDSLPWRWVPSLILGGNRLPEYTDATTYTGLLPWAAVLLAAALGRAERRWAFPAVLMAAGAGLALGRNFVLYRLLTLAPGGGALIGPMRALGLWALGAALLAGLVCRRLSEVERPRLFRRLSALGAAAGAALTAVALHKVRPELRVAAVLHSDILPPELFQQLNLGLGAVLAALWLISAGVRGGGAGRRSVIFAVLLTADLFHFAPRVFVFYRPAGWFEPPVELGVVAPSPHSPFLPRVLGYTPTQIFNESEDDVRPARSFQPKWNDLFRVPSAAGWDPVFLRRYGELVDALGLREPLDDPFRSVRFASVLHPFLNFIQAEFIIGDPWERAVSRRRIVVPPEGVIMPATGEGEWERMWRIVQARREESGARQLSGDAASAGPASPVTAPALPRTADTATTSPSAPLLLPRVTAVRLLHYTVGGLMAPHGAEVGRVELRRGGRTLESFPVRWGVEVADQLAPAPELTPGHAPPQTVAAWPVVQFTVYLAGRRQKAAMFLAEFRLAEPREGDSLAFVPSQGLPPGIRWVIEAVSIRDEPSDDGFTLERAGLVAPVWRNRRVQPFVWAARAVERPQSDALALERLKAFTVRDWAERAVLAPEGSNGPVPASDGQTSAGVEWLSPSRMLLHTRSDKPFLAVLSQLWHPGWRAEVVTSSGAEPIRLPVERVNHCFQGIVVPAGSNTVRLFYRPDSLTMGLIHFAAALAAITAVAGCGWAGRLQKRRARRRCQTFSNDLSRPHEEKRP
ncbi:MAG: hypothetical protein Kow0059_17250 [Candidatus Sumerlaeia bacterium]